MATPLGRFGAMRCAAALRSLGNTSGHSAARARAFCCGPTRCYGGSGGRGASHQPSSDSISLQKRRRMSDVPAREAQAPPRSARLTAAENDLASLEKTWQVLRPAGPGICVYLQEVERFLIDTGLDLDFLVSAAFSRMHVVGAGASSALSAGRPISSHLISSHLITRTLGTSSRPGVPKHKCTRVCMHACASCSCWPNSRFRLFEHCTWMQLARGS
jgi:hypothetical protein